VLGSRLKELPAVELAIGVTLLLAWLVEHGGRFGASGITLTGLGVGLVIAEHLPAYSAYREELAFGGIALGLMIATRVTRGALRGAGLGLLAVAVSEAALQRLPAVVSAPNVFRAFADGWAFGLVIAAYGLVLALASRRSPRPARR
ncbi:MAG: hypothetical protein ACRDOD_23845, partial [Streptosporangiaceae bacterium]